MSKFYINTETYGDIKLVTSATDSNDLTYDVGSDDSNSYIDYYNGKYYFSDGGSTFYIFDDSLDLLVSAYLQPSHTSLNPSDNKVYIGRSSNNVHSFVDTNTNSFTDKYFGSPYGTLWNSDYVSPSSGFGDLSDYTTRDYADFQQAWGGNDFDIVGREFVMYDTINSKYHKVVFDSWETSYGGGGFSYSRAEIIDPVTFGPTISFILESYGTQSDNIDNSIEITRNFISSGIYNNEYESYYTQNIQPLFPKFNPVDNKVYYAELSSRSLITFDNNLNFVKSIYGVPESPVGTLWNSDFVDKDYGWNDLANYTERRYTSFRKSLNNNVGNNIVGRELVMFDLINDKYYKVMFDFWQGGNNGGGFSYSRVEIIDPVTFGPTVSFIKTNYGSEEDIIDTGLVITRGNQGAIYNSATESQYIIPNFENIDVNTTTGDIYLPADNGFMGIYSTAGTFSFIPIPLTDISRFLYNPDNNRVYIGGFTNNIYSVDVNSGLSNTINISSFVPNGVNFVSSIRYSNSKVIVSVLDNNNQSILLNIDSSDNVTLIKSRIGQIYSVLEANPGSYSYIKNGLFVIDQPDFKYDVLSTIDPPVGATSNTNHQLQSKSGILAHLDDLNSVYTTVYGATGLGISTGKIIWVDEISGNDSTGQPYKFFRPYQTIYTALIYATSGDTVVVRPGEYDVYQYILKNGVNIHFELGAKIYCYTTPFFDNGTAVVATITGKGYFIMNVFAGDSGFCRITSSGSIVHIEFDEIYGFNNVGFGGTNGTLSIRGRKYTELFQYMAYITGSLNLLFLEVDEMIGQGFLNASGVLFRDWCIDGVSRTARVKIGNLRSNAVVFSIAPLSMFYCGASAKVEFEGTITSTATSAGSSCITILGNGTAIIKGRLFSTAARSASVFSSGNSNLILRDTYAITTATSSLTLYASNAGANLKIENSYISGASQSIIYQTGSANVEIHNSRIHNRSISGPSITCMETNAGGTLVLNNVVMYNNSTSANSYSIKTLTTQNVKIYNPVVSNKELGPNVTPVMGTYIYDTDINTITNSDE